MKKIKSGRTNLSGSKECEQAFLRYKTRPAHCPAGQPYNNYSNLIPANLVGRISLVTFFAKESNTRKQARNKSYDALQQVSKQELWLIYPTKAQTWIPPLGS